MTAKIYDHLYDALPFSPSCEGLLPQWPTMQRQKFFLSKWPRVIRYCTIEFAACLNQLAESIRSFLDTIKRPLISIYKLDPLRPCHGDF
jgi:hypothetical protein